MHKGSAALLCAVRAPAKIPVAGSPSVQIPPIQRPGRLSIKVQDCAVGCGVCRAEELGHSLQASVAECGERGERVVIVVSAAITSRLAMMLWASPQYAREPASPAPQPARACIS
jgi:hypothetical protein